MARPDSCGACPFRYLCAEANRGRDIRRCIVDNGSEIQPKASGGL